MKVIKNKKGINKKIVIIACLIVAGVLIGLFALWFFTRDNLNKQLTEEVDNTSTVREDQITDSPGTDLPQKSPTDTGNVVNPDTETPSTPPEKPRIERADQTDGTIKVVAILHENSSGYCELRLTKSGQETIRRTAKIVIGPKYYTCSFTLSSSVNGWKAELEHIIGNSRTSAESRLVEVR